MGLEQIKEVSPKITVMLSDVYTYDILGYDFVLMDSMVHFCKNDMQKETALVERILSEMKANGVFVNNMIKSAGAEKILHGIIHSANAEFDILEEKYIDYPDFNSIYHFIALKKIKA